MLLFPTIKFVPDCMDKIYHYFNLNTLISNVFEILRLVQNLWSTPKHKKAHTNRRKGNPRASKQGDQRDCTTESHRMPTTDPPY